mmetsp:Transcript_48603/g.152527  ORF Transcript_48603/g.152527 Transcript_48603/m.152527 type:complete len:244 (+) Transcript_48603:282-1013(+)
MLSRTGTPRTIHGWSIRLGTRNVPSCKVVQPGTFRSPKMLRLLLSCLSLLRRWTRRQTMQSQKPLLLLAVPWNHRSCLTAASRMLHERVRAAMLETNSSQLPRRGSTTTFSLCRALPPKLQTAKKAERISSSVAARRRRTRQSKNQELTRSLRPHRCWRCGMMRSRRQTFQLINDLHSRNRLIHNRLIIIRGTRSKDRSCRTILQQAKLTRKGRWTLRLQGRFKMDGNARLFLQRAKGTGIEH